MKRIGIDARLAFQTGVGTYTRNLLSFLQSYIPEDGYECFVFMRTEDIEKMNLSHSAMKIIPSDYPWHSLSEQTLFLKQLLSYKLDLMHFTYFSFPTLYKKPYIITIHDLIQYTYPTGKASTKGPLYYAIKKLGYTYTLQTGLHNAKHIITPTESVKSDLVTLLNVNPLRITVTYEGVDLSLLSYTHEIVPESLKEITQNNFYLYVGNFYPHKNIETLLDSYKKANISESLILVGPHDFFSKRIKEEYASTPGVYFLHDILPSELTYLYEHAQALIHPSKAEGFGLPVIEAASFGTPIIASDIPVFNEILGDDYYKMQPLDAESIVKALKIKKSKLPPPPVNTELRFSFDTMAAETWKLYISLLS